MFTVLRSTVICNAYGDFQERDFRVRVGRVERLGMDGWDRVRLDSGVEWMKKDFKLARAGEGRGRPREKMTRTAKVTNDGRNDKRNESV